MSAELFLLDTDTSSFIIKRRFPSILAGVAISTITRGELLYGLQRLDENHRLRATVQLFLRTTWTLDWTSSAADEYARIRHHLTAGGEKIAEPDMMIAAHAIALKATLVTNNLRHFNRVQALGLRLENGVDPIH